MIYNIPKLPKNTVCVVRYVKSDELKYLMVRHSITQVFTLYSFSKGKLTKLGTSEDNPKLLENKYVKL